MMGKRIRLGVLGILLCLALPLQSALAENDGRVSHVVLVWLKQPGNEKMRHDFVSASRQLGALPGVINRHVGIVMQSDRAIVDDTFDVAVTVTFENEAALRAYMQHPRHKKILEEKIKPMVNRVVAYNFISG